MVITILVSFTLIALSGLHVYWASGGRWWLDRAIPEISGRPMFEFGPIGALVVAAGLLGIGLTAGLRGFQLVEQHAGSPSHWACLAFAIVFSLRAVGDFRVAGFFKRIRSTTFATWDTLVYTPLCVALGAGLFYICTL